jgi:hypothetical protein
MQLTFPFRSRIRSDPRDDVPIDDDRVPAVEGLSEAGKVHIGQLRQSVRRARCPYSLMNPSRWCPRLHLATMKTTSCLLARP